MPQQRLRCAVARLILRLVRPRLPEFERTLWPEKPPARRTSHRTAAPVAQRETRRARAEIAFDEPQLARARCSASSTPTSSQIENRLGVYISARGNRVQIEGPRTSRPRARRAQAMYDRLAQGQDLDAGAVEGVIAMSNEPTLDGIITGEIERRRS